MNSKSTTVPYRGWLITVGRVGMRGEWTGRADPIDGSDKELLVGRFGGKGAKQQAIETLMAKIDAMEGGVK